MSYRSIGGNEWRDLGTTGEGQSGPADTRGLPTLHSGVMYGKSEHETGFGRRSGYTGSGMGHIGAGGYASGSNARRPLKQKASSTQDPNIDVSPLVSRSDSFSSLTGQQQTGVRSTSKAKANFAGTIRQSAENQPVCKREAFYVVEDRPVIIARTQFIREHRFYEVEFVKETYFNKERELVNDQPEEIVEQKERIIQTTPPNPCACVTGEEYGIQGFSGLQRSLRSSVNAAPLGYSSLPRSRRSSQQELF